MSALVVAVVADAALLSVDDEAPAPDARLLGINLAERALLQGDRLGASELFLVGGGQAPALQASAMVARIGEGRRVAAPVATGSMVELLDLLMRRRDATVLITSPWLMLRTRHIQALLEHAAAGPVLCVARAIDPVRPWPEVALQDFQVARLGPHLEAADGQALPMIAGPAAVLAPLLAEEGALIERLARPGRTRACILPDAAFATVLRKGDARRAARFLLAGVTSSADGIVDTYLNRRVSRYVTLLVIDGSVTPNHITAVSMTLGLLAAALVAAGSHPLVVAGAALLQVSAMVDCADGEVARLKYLESRSGAYFDIIADNVVHVLLFLAVGRAVSLTHGPLALRLGAAAAAGALISFLLVFATVLRKGKQGEATEDARAIERFIDKMTNRDFSLLLLLCAALDRLAWFLWALAIGVQIFWMALCALKVRAAVRARETVERPSTGRAAGA